MCFYIFSPQKEIQVEFISESISLTPFGSSRIFCDILINNPGDIPINDLIMIIPNRFFKIKRKGNYLSFRDGDFHNLTDQLKNPADPINLTYKLCGHEMVWEPPHTLKIIKPKRDKIEELITFSGEIIDDGQNRFHFLSDLMEVTHYFLNYINFSIFRYSFRTALEPNKKRWLRILLAPRKTAINQPSAFRMTVLWLLDSLKFSYKILGPLNVLNSFKEQVGIQEWQIKKNMANEKDDDIKTALNNQLGAVLQVKKEIIEPAMKSKSTFKHLSVHVFPLRLRILESLYAYGVINPIGTIPNYLDDKDISLRSSASWRRRVYDWECEDIKNPEKDTFGILFTGHSSNRLLRAFLLLVAFWIFATQLIIPAINFFLLEFNLINASNYLKKITNWIFIDYPWISIVVSLICGLLITQIIDKIRKLFKRLRIR